MLSGQVLFLTLPRLYEDGFSLKWPRYRLVDSGFLRSVGIPFIGVPCESTVCSIQLLKAGCSFVPQQVSAAVCGVPAVSAVNAGSPVRAPINKELAPL